MPLTWTQRLTRLCKILCTDVVTDDEGRQGEALDRYLISRKKQSRGDVEALCFTDEDLRLIGTLAVGQFGVVDVVRCRLDSKVYVRKTIEKRIALRARGQCSPQLERDLLLRALMTKSFWAPHLLCAFQTETALKLVMQYADGGNLWDVIESSPEGKISETDLKWWTPQIVSAIDWCHSQGFVHRDIKPHNFVLTPSSHLLLVDYGSAAPLLPPSPSGVQLIPKEHCIVPCGTCDYISPEVLKCHEEALVALELDDDQLPLKGSAETSDEDGGAYGRETDWWSFGAMVYEMSHGVAPFFANDVGQTYLKIVEHRSSLQLRTSTTLSASGISLLEGVLCDKEHRLGRRSVSEIKEHSFFYGVDWTGLHQRKPFTLPHVVRCLTSNSTEEAPSHLRLPQFTYSTVASHMLMDPKCLPEDGKEEEKFKDESVENFSHPFAFSALFQSSRSSPGTSVLGGSTACTRPASLINPGLNSFVGFSWGPRLSAFNPQSSITHETTRSVLRPLHHEPVDTTSHSTFPIGTGSLQLLQTNSQTQAFRTPIRASSEPIVHRDGLTFSITRTGTARRMQGTRPLSDREAMQQLVDCVGMSARKKVLESGKKPMHIRTASGPLVFKTDAKPSASIPKPLVINARTKGDMSATTSESESQPPSPTPRPGSALSRRSGWGGRSTPSLAAGRCTPTLTYTATGIGVSRSGLITKDSNGSTVSLESLRRSSSFDEKLRDAERRHDQLLDKLTNLEKKISTVVLHLNS